MQFSDCAFIFQFNPFEDNMCYSGSGGGTASEPIAAVSMNDELQSARASVAKAEAEILSMLTAKVVEYLISKVDILYDYFTHFDANQYRCKWILIKSTM